MFENARAREIERKRERKKEIERSKTGVENCFLFFLLVLQQDYCFLTAQSHWANKSKNKLLTFRACSVVCANEKPIAAPRAAILENAQSFKANTVINGFTSLSAVVSPVEFPKFVPKVTNREMQQKVNRR